MPCRTVRTTRTIIGILLCIPLVVTLFFGQYVREVYQERFLLFCNYIGEAVFALTGSMVAGHEGMDLTGCMMVGFATAMGGGTWRDMWLGRRVFWLKDWDEALLVVVASFVSYIVWPFMSHRWKLSLEDEWVFWTDTVGLGAFASMGAYTATQMTPSVHVGGCAACGMFSACFGGLTRDILTSRPIRILHDHAEIYATPCFFGGAATAAWIRYKSEDEHMEAVLLGYTVCVLVRILAVNFSLRLPSYTDWRARAIAGRAIPELESALRHPIRELERFDDDGNPPLTTEVSTRARALENQAVIQSLRTRLATLEDLVNASLPAKGAQAASDHSTEAPMCGSPTHDTSDDPADTWTVVGDPESLKESGRPGD